MRRVARIGQAHRRSMIVRRSEDPGRTAKRLERRRRHQLHARLLEFAGGNVCRERRDRRGCESVLARYKREYPDQAARAINFSDVEVRFLGPDAALVLGQWHRIAGLAILGESSPWCFSGCRRAGESCTTTRVWGRQRRNSAGMVHSLTQLAEFLVRHGAGATSQGETIGKRLLPAENRHFLTRSVLYILL